MNALSPDGCKTDWSLISNVLCRGLQTISNPACLLALTAIKGCSHCMISLSEASQRQQKLSSWGCTHILLPSTHCSPDASWVMQTLSCLNKPAVGSRGDEATAKSVAGLSISWVTDEFIERRTPGGHWVNHAQFRQCSRQYLRTQTHTHTHILTPHAPRLMQTPDSTVTHIRATVSHLCTLVDKQAWGEATQDVCVCVNVNVCVLPVWLQWYHH